MRKWITVIDTFCDGLVAGWHDEDGKPSSVLCRTDESIVIEKILVVTADGKVVCEVPLNDSVCLSRDCSLMLSKGSVSVSLGAT